MRLFDKVKKTESQASLKLNRFCGYDGSKPKTKLFAETWFVPQ